MKHLLMGAAALAVLTGCNQTDTPSSSDKPAEVTLSEPTIPAGNPAKAGDALAAMSLSDSGSGAISFAGKQVDGANATFSDVAVTGEESVSVGSLVFEGLDVAENGQATFGKMSLNNIVMSDGESDEEVKVGNFELTNPSPELATWMTASMNGQEVPFPAADKVTFDSWSISDISADFNEDGDSGTFGIGKMEIRDMGGLKAKRAVISGLTLDVDSGDMEGPVTASLGSITMTNLDAKFVKALQDASGDEDEMVAAVMNAAYENPMDPGFDSFDMQDLKFDAAGASFDLPSLVSFVERNAAGQPVKYVTEPFTATLNADAEGGEAGAALLEGLSQIGYEKLTLKGAGKSTYDPDKDIVSFTAEDNFVELVDGAKFSFGGKIEGYSAYSKEVGQSFNFAEMAEGAEPDPDAMAAAMGKLIFHNFEFSIDDDSLLDRAFNAAATAQGQDPAEMKSQLTMGLAMAPMMAQGSGIDMALVTEATGALGKFISDGGKLTIKIDPTDPLSVASIMENPDPSAFTKESLGFSATQK